MRQVRAILSILRQLLPGLAALGVYAVVAVVLCSLPLFSVLGYESSFVLAIVGSFVSMHVAVVLVHRLRRERTDPLVGALTPIGALMWLYGRVLGLNLLLLILPLDILSANAVVVRNCNYFNGLTWFVMLPALSVVVATAWGVALGLLPLRKRWTVPAGYLVVLGSLALGFWRFYVEPPVCQYDPFAGYFSGNLYDDHIAITGPLLAARLYHLAGAAVVLLVAARFFLAGELRLGWRHDERRRALTAGVVAGLGVVVGLYFAGGPLAYTVSAGDLNRALGGRHETPHFTIHYPQGSLTEREIRLHAADAELRWHQLRRFYGAAPAHKIRIYYFRDGEQKRRLYGAANVDMAKPWRLEVYLTQRFFPHPVLKHELAHAFSAVFGDGAFGVSVRWGRLGGVLPVPLFNPGLIEGSAVAASWSVRGGLTPHQWARAMRLLGKAPALEAVMGYGFLKSAAGRSYTLAGSFCRFLVTRHGAAAFRKVYKSGGDFRAAYGLSLAALEHQWATFLRSVPLTQRELGLARERFRHRPLFARPCLHEVARLDRVADRLMARGQYRAASKAYAQLCRFDPGDPGHLMDRLAAEAETTSEDRALAVARSLWAHRATTPPLRARALWLLGNQAWRADRPGRAAELFREAATFAIPESTQRDIVVRGMALADPRLGQSLRPLLAPKDDEPPHPEAWKRLARDHPRLGLAHYLFGSYRLLQDEFDGAARSLERALELGLPDVRFRREALRRLGRAYLRAFRLQRARVTFSHLTSPAESQAVRLWAQDWIERVDFWSRHGARFGLGPQAKIETAARTGGEP
ncbi:MAG: hypothetical protein ABI333_25275 [bacterium]